MTDNLRPEDRKKTMLAVKSQGTKLERRLWAMLAGMGIRGWKKNVGTITGKPDVVFASKSVVLFIDGCFWHGCPVCNRKLPKTNTEYWNKKINRNIELASLHNMQLQKEGWIVVRIWEHEMRDTAPVRARIRFALESKEKEIESTA